MYCSQCGRQADGKFCSECGAALQLPTLPPGGWEHELRYDVLVRVPEVRAMIDGHSRLSRKKMTGEQFLALCEKLVPTGVPLERLAGIIQPITAALGMCTGKERAESIGAPVGRVIVRVLCSLAKGGQSIRSVQQASDGCLFEAALPSDFWSLEGDLVVAVRQKGPQTEVRALTKIKGQLFDWGKSQCCLERLFADLHAVSAVVVNPLQRVA